MQKSKGKNITLILYIYFTLKGYAFSLQMQRNFEADVKNSCRYLYILHKPTDKAVLTESKTGSTNSQAGDV